MRQALSGGPYVKQNLVIVRGMYEMAAMTATQRDEFYRKLGEATGVDDLEIEMAKAVKEAVDEERDSAG